MPVAFLYILAHCESCPNIDQAHVTAAVQQVYKSHVHRSASGGSERRSNGENRSSSTKHSSSSRSSGLSRRSQSQYEESVAVAGGYEVQQHAADGSRQKSVRRAGSDTRYRTGSPASSRNGSGSPYDMKNLHRSIMTAGEAIDAVTAVDPSGNR